MYSALIQVVSRIVSAGAQWSSNARTQAHNIINAVKGGLSGINNAISSALSGVVGAFTAPFKQAYNEISNIAGHIKKKVEDAANDAKSLVGYSAGEGTDLYGNIYQGGQIVGNINDTGGYVQSPTSSSGGSLDLNHELKLTFNFENVPDHIDENHLIQALSSKQVIQSIVGNPDFQSLDRKVKDSLIAKNSRARGV
jgi:hypothetical protein